MTNLATVAPGTAVEDYGYRPAPAGVRANMIFSADGAAGFAGRAGPLSCPADQQLLLALRAYADVVLVGAGTARAFAHEAEESCRQTTVWFAKSFLRYG